MAALGDIGRADVITPRLLAYGMFGRNAAAAVTATIGAVVPMTNVFLITRAGMVIDSASADSSGVARFYDMDNGIYTAYSAGTGDVWQVTVTAGSASVVKLFTSNRAMARAWVG